jgi:hypothetical protein
VKIYKIDEKILAFAGRTADWIQGATGFSCFVQARALILLKVALEVVGSLETSLIDRILDPSLSMIAGVLLLGMSFWAEFRCPPSRSGAVTVNSLAEDGFFKTLRLAFVLAVLYPITLMLRDVEFTDKVRFSSGLFDWFIIYLISSTPKPPSPARERRVSPA